jgi:hypothetical protein
MLKLQQLVHGPCKLPVAAAPGTYPDDPALLPPPSEQRQQLRGLAPPLQQHLAKLMVY